MADEAVAIGGNPPGDSYLRLDRIIDAAQATGADAVHPGYGFLSENEQFAAACRDRGLTFIGPTPEAISRMGSKTTARRIAMAAGVPVVPGTEEPFGPEVSLFGRQVTLYITDVNVGLLYIVSVASIGVYGLILAGYASNSKYPLLASLRASAQLISYEVAVTLTLVSVIMVAGSLSMVSIVRAQESQHVWFAFIQPVAFVIFFIGGLAETNRAPFDLPEAEQELTGGFHTEYSGMRFALFFLAEYANIIVVSSVATTLFFGGWLRPFPNVAALSFLDFIPSWTWFLIKSFVFLYIFIWVRATLPRYRYDQLMRLGWKVLIPLAIANLVVTGIVKVLLL